MNLSRTLDRRTFVVDLGRGSLALAVLGIAGCAPAATGSGGPARSLATSDGAAPDGSASASAAASASNAASESSGAGAPLWARVNLGFVSAYILVHGGEAAIVDTGVEGSGDAIAAGPDRDSASHWPAVAHVILTQQPRRPRGQRRGRPEPVPADATGYAGRRGHRRGSPSRAAADAGPGLRPRRPSTSQVDHCPPGHTAGSIRGPRPAAGGILVVGDAMGTSNPAHPRCRAPSSPRTWSRRRHRSSKLGNPRVRDAARRPRRADRVRRRGARREAGSSPRRPLLASDGLVADDARPATCSEAP